LIAEKYVFSQRFVVDTLSYLGSLPGISDGSILKLFKVLKMVRVRRLTVFIKKLNLPEQLKAFIDLVVVAFYLCLWLHIQACIWFAIVNFKGHFPQDFEEILNEQDPLTRLLLNPETGEEREYNPWYPPLDWIDYT
jgi:hypothetical protein